MEGFFPFCFYAYIPSLYIFSFIDGCGGGIYIPLAHFICSYLSYIFFSVHFNIDYIFSCIEFQSTLPNLPRDRSFSEW